MYEAKRCKGKLLKNSHSAKIVPIPSFSGRYFPAFGLNTQVYRVNICIQSECGKIRTRKTQNTDTFNAASETSENLDFVSLLSKLINIKVSH